MPQTSEQRREYLRNYQRAWKQRRRDSYMADKVCVVCGGRDRLEVDHIDPATKISHRFWSWSWARIHEELAKCQILCREHHQRKSASQLPQIAQHGGRRMYDLGCRCEPCRWAKRQANARRYKK